MLYTIIFFFSYTFVKIYQVYISQSALTCDSFKLKCEEKTYLRKKWNVLLDTKLVLDTESTISNSF